MAPARQGSTSPTRPSKDRGQRGLAHETAGSSTFGLISPQSQAVVRAAKQVATAEALSNLHSIQARVASTIETYEASEAAPDLCLLGPNELGLGEAIDPGEAMRVRAELIMTSLRQVAEERTETLADLHSMGEARRKEIAEAERREELRRRSSGGQDEAEPVGRPDEFYSRLEVMQEQHGRMRARGGAFLLASSRLHRKVADVLEAASRCATAEERAAELESALSEMAEQRDEAGAALEEAQEELAKAKAELRLRGRSASRKKELTAEHSPATPHEEPPMPPPPDVNEPGGETSAEGAAACGALFGRQMGEWLWEASATRAHADAVARSIAAQVAAVAAAAALEIGALLSEAAGEAEPAWQTAREAAARRRARALLTERGAARAAGPSAEMLRERREASAREEVLFRELREVDAAGNAEALAVARARAEELGQRLAAMEPALEEARAQGALARQRAVETERKLEAIGAAIGLSGGSLADELGRMQEALAAAALALEEARAEARREMAAVVAVFGREIDELEVEFGEWREDAWERERLLNLAIERFGLEAQMLADETETVERAVAAAAREGAQIRADAAASVAGNDARLLQLQASHEARLRSRRFSLMREHACRYEAERRLAQAAAHDADGRTALVAQAEARAAGAEAGVAAAREAEGAARLAADEMGGRMHAVEAELGEARREVEALRLAATEDQDRREELEWRLSSLESGWARRESTPGSSRPGTANSPRPARAAAGAPGSPRGIPGSQLLPSRPSTPLINFVPPACPSAPPTPGAALRRDTSARAAGASSAGGSRCASRPWSAAKAVAMASEALARSECSVGSTGMGSAAASSPSTPRGQLGRAMGERACAGASISEDGGVCLCTPPSNAAGRNSRPHTPSVKEAGLRVRLPPTDPALLCAPIPTPPTGAAAPVIALWADDDDYATAALYRPSGGAVQKRSTQDQEATPRKARRDVSEPAEGDRAAVLGTDASELRVEASAALPRSRDDGGRVAFLSRQAIGHSPMLGIQAAIRPALHTPAPEDVRAILCKLFTRQRQLSSQRALDNWELLALAGKLRPRQELLHRIRRSLQERKGQLLLGGSRVGTPHGMVGRGPTADAGTASQPGEGGSKAEERPGSPLRPPSRSAPGHAGTGAGAGVGGASPTAAAAEQAGSSHHRLMEAIERRLGSIAALLARNQQRFGFAAQVHSLRRDAFATLAHQLLTRTLHALTRLTDAVNTEPASALRNNSPGERAAAARAFDPVDFDCDELARIVFGMPGAGSRAAESYRGSSKHLRAAPVTGAPETRTSAAAPLSAAPALPFAPSEAATLTWSAAHLVAIEVASRVGLAAGKSGSFGRAVTPVGHAHKASLLHPAFARRSRSPPREADLVAAANQEEHRSPTPGRSEAAGRPATVPGFLVGEPAWGSKAGGASPRTTLSAGGAPTPRGGARASPRMDALTMDTPPEVSPRTVLPDAMRAAASGTDSRTVFRSSPPPPAAQPPRKGTAEAVALSAAFRSDVIRRGSGLIPHISS